MYSSNGTISTQSPTQVLPSTQPVQLLQTQSIYSQYAFPNNNFAHTQNPTSLGNKTGRGGLFSGLRGRRNQQQAPAGSIIPLSQTGNPSAAPLVSTLPTPTSQAANHNDHSYAPVPVTLLAPAPASGSIISGSSASAPFPLSQPVISSAQPSSSTTTIPIVPLSQSGIPPSQPATIPIVPLSQSGISSSQLATIPIVPLSQSGIPPVQPSMNTILPLSQTGIKPAQLPSKNITLLSQSGIPFLPTQQAVVVPPVVAETEPAIQQVKYPIELAVASSSRPSSAALSSSSSSSSTSSSPSSSNVSSPKMVRTFSGRLADPKLVATTAPLNGDGFVGTRAGPTFMAAPPPTPFSGPFVALPRGVAVPVGKPRFFHKTRKPLPPTMAAGSAVC